MPLDYTQFGGVLVTPDNPRAYALIGDPSVTEPVWNFGRLVPDSVAQMSLEQGRTLTPARLRDGPSFYDLAPHLKGFGEGATVVLPHLTKRVLGAFFRSQYQNRGTCVSRGAKRTGDHCQTLAMYLGESRKFDYLSHALIYGGCREYGNDLSRQDGAVGEWAAWWVKNGGNLLNADVKDDDNDDALAVEWGYRGVPADVKAKAKEQGHFVVEIVPIRSTAEARDFLCSGMGAITVASNVGYEGSRDSQGVIRRRGSWSHQMMYSGWRDDLKAFLQEQSWGPDQPGGPLGSIEIPSYSWWTLEADAAAQIRENDCFGYKAIRGWDAAELTYRP